MRYAYASMDAFTDDLSKIAIPTAGSKATFQTAVKNLTVVSNAKGVVVGTKLPGGNIEFWPDNYGPANAGKVADASTSLYDFGDERSAPVDGYGCMQVHYGGAKQTVFAVNHWKSIHPDHAPRPGAPVDQFADELRRRFIAVSHSISTFCAGP